MRTLTVLSIFAIAICVAAARQWPAPANTLDIYVVDVEGGNATLIKAPSGESVLIDTGHLDAAVRDADRIMEALNDAGIKQIDHLITTHWHLDHFGGMAELARRVPINEFIDHGANVQPKPAIEEFLAKTYPSLYRHSRHIVAKPGDAIRLHDVDMKVVSSAGHVIRAALSGAGTPNSYCDEMSKPKADLGENSQSIGVHIRFGHFRAIHLGDLSADKEYDLMCPINPIGFVDLFIVSHHGQTNSNNPVLVHAIRSRAAIMNNGTRKGGDPEVMKVIYSAPGLQTLWQLHFSELSGQEYTVPGLFIANMTDQPAATMPIDPLPEPAPGTGHAGDPPHNGKAYWIKVSARSDGSFTVTNTRTRFSKQYGSP
jgi:competence protein ComEC